MNFVKFVLVTGFHQKCHIPNIPASALELSTPWNCSYCQKGIKCPYLTESLDVLQNLLSDDECSGTEDNTDATVVFDSDHYEPDSVDDVTMVSPRKKRVRYCSGPLCVYPSLVVSRITFLFVLNNLNSVCIWSAFLSKRSCANLNINF